MSKWENKHKRVFRCLHRVPDARAPGPRPWAQGVGPASRGSLSALCAAGPPDTRKRAGDAGPPTGPRSPCAAKPQPPCTPVSRKPGPQGPRPCRCRLLELPHRGSSAGEARACSPGSPAFSLLPSSQGPLMLACGTSCLSARWAPPRVSSRAP